MIEFDVDMGYLLECDELDKIVLNDECGEHEPMEFVPIAATVGRCDTMGLWHEWEQVLFANVSDEVAQDNLNECVHELLDKAATVGAGTLTAEQVRECSKGVYFEGYSDGATHRVNGIEETDWQAIADKLNASLGAVTCRNKGFVDDGGWYFVCSKCGCEFEYGDFACEFAEGHGFGSPKFCPNCGKKVVGA
jgi:hypothetical protein